MASVTSQSSRDDVIAAMVDNASYAEDNSLAKANAFVTACTVWLIKFAFKSSGSGQSTIAFDSATVQKSIDAARAWIATQPAPRAKTGGNVVLVSVENFRE